MPATIHIVGAGLAGLSAAVACASRGMAVVVHEAATQAGGRCRSYHDTRLGVEIDNGNHLLLSGNRAALAYLTTIGALDRISIAPEAAFPFVDLASGERWIVRANEGRVPWWIFSRSRRVPGSSVADHAALMRLLRQPEGATIAAAVKTSGVLYERLLAPMLIAALNTAPEEAAATLAGAVIRETLASGGRNCRPIVARGGLSGAFVTPALAFIERTGGRIRLGQRLRKIETDAGLASALIFHEERIALAEGDGVVLAASAQSAAAMLPGLVVPTEYRAIVNAHFRAVAPPALPPVTGIVNGLAQWLFAFPDRLSVTISAADHLLDVPREDLASRIWRDVTAVAGVPSPMPPWQLVRERRATFAATPAQNAKRPEAKTAFGNLVLAGDWTATGLPATIEGAVRSGVTAANSLAVQLALISDVNARHDLCKDRLAQRLPAARFVGRTATLEPPIRGSG